MTTSEHSLQLPDLQDAVDALHARLFDGAGASPGAALPMTGAGPSDDPGPDGLRILEAAFSGRHAERFGQWWGGDYSRWDGDASDADWFGANEVAYQAIRLGLDGPDLGARLEPVIRSGPWRPKLDSPRPGKDADGNPIRTTVLGLLIGKAIHRQRERAASVPRLQFHQGGSGAVDDESADESTPPPADETCEQKVIRLERELAEEKAAHALTRAADAVKATIIRAQRTELDGWREWSEGLRGLLKRPDLSGNQKVYWIAQLGEIYSGHSRGEEWVTVYRDAVTEKSGLSAGTVSDMGSRFKDVPDLPVESRLVTRRAVDADGVPKTVTVAEWRAKAPRLGEAYRQLATIELPDRPKHGGTRVARCPDHQDADLIIRTTTVCSICHKEVSPPEEKRASQVDTHTPAPLRRGCSVSRGGKLTRTPPPPNGNGHDSENGHPDRAALEMVATPLGSDRADGDQDYSRSKNGHSEAPRLLITSKAGANGHAPPAPPVPCTCDGAYASKVGDHWLCSDCGGVPAPLEVAP
jgi:hypothetical protein